MANMREDEVKGGVHHPEDGEFQVEYNHYNSMSASYSTSYPAVNTSSSLYQQGAEERARYVALEMNMLTENMASYYLGDEAGSVQRLEFGPILSSDDLTREIDKLMSHLQPNPGVQVKLVCRNNRSIRGILYGLAQAHHVDLSSYQCLKEYFIYDCNSIQELAQHLFNRQTNDLAKECISEEYHPVPNLEDIAKIPSESCCTLALKLNSCKDQSLSVIWSWFYGLDIIPGGICPLINKFGSGSRSQDILVQLRSEEHTKMAWERWTQKWKSVPPRVEAFRSSVITCSIHKSSVFKSIFDDVHTSCKRFLHQMANRPTAAIVRLKGLTFQTTSNQLLSILKKDIPDLPINDAEEEGSIIMPLRGNQQSLKTGDAFVLCHDTHQALLVKQRFTHFHHGQRTWEVYLSSVGEMVQVFRAHSKGEFVSRNKRSNPFTTPSLEAAGPLLSVIKPDVDDSTIIQPLFPNPGDKHRGIVGKIVSVEGGQPQGVPTNTADELISLQQANTAINLAKVPLPFSSALPIPMMNFQPPLPSMVGNVPILCGIDSNTTILSQNILLGLLNSSVMSPPTDTLGFANSLAANPFLGGTPLFHPTLHPLHSTQITPQSLLQLQSVHSSLPESLSSMYTNSGYLLSNNAAATSTTRHPFSSTPIHIPCPPTALIPSMSHTLHLKTPHAIATSLLMDPTSYSTQQPAMLLRNHIPQNYLSPTTTLHSSLQAAPTNGESLFSCSTTVPAEQSLFCAPHTVSSTMTSMNPASLLYSTKHFQHYHD